MSARTLLRRAALTRTCIVEPPPPTYTGPDGIWNPNTGSWVLWIAQNGYVAFTAPSPAGPYTLARRSVNVTIQNATEACGDYHLFVDPRDNTPYVIAGCHFYMFIERLMPNLLDSAGDRSPTGHYQFPEYFVEAPTLFLRGNVYYAVFTLCCCFCMQGSGAIVYTAPHPLGPWTAQGADIACVPDGNSTAGAGASAGAGAGAGATDAHLAAALGLGGIPTPSQGCEHRDPNTTSAVLSQQSFIAEVETPAGPAFLWAGDRWQQSFDGTKGHDPQFWAPLAFDAQGAILPLRWIDNFTINVI